MRSPGNRRRALPRWWPTAVVAGVVTALIVGASVSEGFPAADLRLDDGSVWVTNSSLQMVGHLNAEIGELSASTQMANRTLDVVQEGDQALTRDSTTNQLQKMDTARAVLGGAAVLPANAQVSLRAGVVAVADPATGRAWARPVDDIMGVDFLRAEPDFDLGPGGQLQLDGEGRPVGLAPTRGELVRPDGEELAIGRVPLTLDPTGVQLSLVGEKAVVLDARGGHLWVEGSDPIDVPLADTARLAAPTDQQVMTAEGPAEAVFANGSTLYGVSAGGLGGRRLLTLAEGVSGTPVQPVVVAGCAYGAWTGGVPTAAQVCSQVAPRISPLPELSPQANLAFRVNRSVVVLNDLDNGLAWIASRQMQLVSTWDNVAPPKPRKGEGTENDDTTEKVDPNRSDRNQRPTAVDDSFAARAGRSTVLPVVKNDTDPDGDILTVSEISDVSGAPGVQISPVRGGTSLQIAAPLEAAGATVTFGYTIDDGRPEGTDTATVSVQILDPDPRVTNAAPAPYEDVEPLVVGLGQQGTKRVDLDWFDPDGDEVIFTGARTDGDDEVAISADGLLTWTDVGTESGRKIVTVTATDGVAETEGSVTIDVRKNRNVPPIANGDYATTTAGQTVALTPLANDVGNDLLLSAVDQLRNARVRPNYDQKVINFTADEPGTYYLTYVVSNGALARGLIRIDVTEPTDENRPPVAAKDVALLPPGGSRLISPLANDEDPDDDVLVIQSVSSDPAVTVRIVQRELLEITSVTALSEPIQLTYQVSDGQHVVPGTVVVLPATDSSRRPVAEPDETIVRAEDTVSVRVLRNDTSPAGLELTVDPELAEAPAGGHAWVDGEYVRFVAPATPGDFRAIYRITDAEGQEASAQIRFLVVGHDVENTAPDPVDVTGRVLAGTSGRIVIPTEGTDPQGDAVRLLGIDSAPQLGRVVQVDQKWLVYEAYDDSAGTDTFNYAVTDALGARSIGRIRVGVVPRDTRNNPPLAVDDAVVAKPGRTVTVNALANDSDPDNDPFGFTAEPFEIDGGGKVVNDSSIEFTVPLIPGTSVGQYTIADRRGAEATGTLRIVSDPNAPLLAPITLDDVVSAGEVAANEVVEVPVLDNDIDPDGDIAAATVTLPDAPIGNGAPDVVDNRVRVRVGDTQQSIRYEVTDSDGQKAWALVVVPGRADAVPGLRTTITPQQVEAGKSLDLQINDFVIGTRGQRVQLTNEDRIWGTNGDLRVVDAGRLTFTAPRDYVGPAAATFEVTDGRDNNDPDGRRAVLSIPIEVTPPPDLPAEINKPPNVSPMTLTIGAGDGPKSADLAKGAFDPEKRELRFTEPTGDLPRGVKVSWSGTTLTAEAASDVAPTEATLRGSVTDDADQRVETVLTIVIKETDRPPPKAVDDVVPDAVQGRTSTVAVLDNDVNPFADRKEPLTLGTVTVESGTGSVTVAGDAVQVTPGADFVGTLIVRYEVSDAAGRQAEARIRLTVRGRPAKPGVPRVGEVADSRAVLTWTAPTDNGSPITGYVVRGQGGGAVEQSCSTTTCTITGLTNNVKYTFVVVARNAIGDSDPSGRSAEVRPDVKPEPPGTPTPKFGDGSIAVSWAASTSKGSPVNKYEIEVSGPGGGLRSVGNVTATEIDGLTNGASYRFRVRAHNDSGEPSNWSAWSRAEVPAGKPSAPRSVVVTDTGGNLGQQARIDWTAPATTNGAELTRYDVYANGSRIGTTTGEVQTFTATLTNGTTYTFTVTATNKAGASPQSAASEPFLAYGAPEQPAPPQLAGSTDGSGTVTSTWAAPQNKGAAITAYQPEASGGAPPAFQASPESVRVSLGQNYRVRFRACAQDKCGPYSAWSNTVKPYGPPGTPTVRSRNNGTSVTFIASGGAPNGSPVSAYQYKQSGQDWRRMPDGRVTVGNGLGQTHTVQVRAVNQAGPGPGVTATEKTDPKPEPKVAVRHGQGPFRCQSTGRDGCYDVLASVTGFPPNTTVTCHNPSPAGRGIRPKSASTNGNGAFNDLVVMNQGAWPSMSDYRVECSGGGVTATGQPSSWPR